MSMSEIRIPLHELGTLIGHEAHVIFDAWLTPDPITPELVVVVKSDDGYRDCPRKRRRHGRLETDQLTLEAALDRTMMNHA